MIELKILYECLKTLRYESELFKTLKLVREVDGWLSDDEGRALFLIAAKIKKPNIIVEIGSYKGKSTIWLARGSRCGRSVKVVSVDPHDGGDAAGIIKALGPKNTLREFRSNLKMAGVNSLVKSLVMSSKEASPHIKGDVGLVFIDGAHDEQHAQQDFDLWSCKVPIGGYIAYHDRHHLGPSNVIKKEFEEGKEFKVVNIVSSMTIAKRIRK